MKLLAALLSLLGSAAHAESREATGWRWMVEACARYLETGERAAFTNPTPDGELVAFPGGGVCNGDPACEGRRMTFIGSQKAGLGAVTVTDHDGRAVGDKPENVVCQSAARFALRDIKDVRAAWLAQALAEKRLVERQSNETGGVYVGCAWNRRQWLLQFSDYGGMLTLFSATLRDTAPECAALTS